VSLALRAGLFPALLAAVLTLLVHLAWAPPVGAPIVMAPAPVAQTSWRSAVYAREFFAAPSGRAHHPGSAAQPLDLATALSSTGPVRPGDLLWLRGGTYSGPFRSELTGTADAFIVVAQFPGERAILDGAAASNRAVLRVEGAYTVYWGFEVTNSRPHRPGRVRGTGVDVFGPYTKFINLVVHHTGNGFGVWTPALEAEVYGNLIYQVGWDDTDRGHGHSIYIQNHALTKRVIDNVLFEARSFGVHAYTSGGEIDNLYFEGNIAFDHGLASAVTGATINFLVGGRREAKRPVLIDNYGYFPWDSGGRNANVGYIDGCSDGLVRGNYLAGGVAMVVTRCSETTVTGNRFVGHVDRATALRFPDNEYVGERPAAARVFVRPNRYVRGRGHVALFNWARERRLRLDLSSLGLRAGEPFEVRDVRNYFGEPLVRTTYRSGWLDLPLDRMGAASTEADGPARPPEFGAVVVVPLGPDTAARPWAPFSDVHE
jgi:hypothetical protein